MKALSAKLVLVVCSLLITMSSDANPLSVNCQSKEIAGGIKARVYGTVDLAMSSTGLLKIDQTPGKRNALTVELYEKINQTLYPYKEAIRFTGTYFNHSGNLVINPIDTKPFTEMSLFSKDTMPSKMFFPNYKNDIDLACRLSFSRN